MDLVWNHGSAAVYGTLGSAGDLLTGGKAPGEKKKKSQAWFDWSFLDPRNCMPQHLIALLGCVIVPWFIFAAVFYVRAMWIRYQYPWLSIALAAWFFLVVLFIGAMATGVCLGKQRSDPKIFGLLSASCALAWVLAFSAADQTFSQYTKAYFDLMKLNTYHSVNPQNYTGQQLVDAGVIEFTRDSHLELRYSTAFKDDDVYCVAPVAKRGGQLNESTSIDFWAVGINCCSAHHNHNFHCGEYNNRRAHSGLRLMRDDHRDYFRLAVQKAEAEFNIQAHYPIFLFWMQTPSDETSAMFDDYVKSFFTAVFSYLCLQLFVVTIGAFVLAKW